MSSDPPNAPLDDGSQDWTEDYLKERRRSAPQLTNKQKLEGMKQLARLLNESRNHSVASLFLLTSVAMFVLPLFVLCIATSVVGPWLEMTDSVTFGALSATATTILVMLFYVVAAFKHDAKADLLRNEKRKKES